MRADSVIACWRTKMLARKTMITIAMSSIPDRLRQASRTVYLAMAKTLEDSGTRAGFEIDLGMRYAGNGYRNGAYPADLKKRISAACGSLNTRFDRWHVFFVPSYLNTFPLIVAS